MPKDTVMSYMLITRELQPRIKYMDICNMCHIDWLQINYLSLNIQKVMYITFENYCNSVLDTLNIKIQNQQMKSK